nr:hypothetical protein [Tanacetum cinerariifolium]
MVIIIYMSLILKVKIVTLQVLIIYLMVKKKFMMLELGNQTLQLKQSKKIIDANFLSRIYNGLPRDEYVEKDVSAEKDVTDEDNLESGEGLTIISDQHKVLLKLQKKLCLWLSIDNVLDTYMLTSGRNTLGVQYMSLFWKATKARYPTRAYFTTDKACDVVKNGISDCFNALIVDARRKSITNMIEDIKVLCIERIRKMRVEHEKWNDGICSDIRTKLEKLKDIH